VWVSLGENLGFLNKSRSKHFWKISDYERIGVSCFEIGKHDFKVEYDKFN
jgi:hypothetical protein